AILAHHERARFGAAYVVGRVSPRLLPRLRRAPHPGRARFCRDGTALGGRARRRDGGRGPAPATAVALPLWAEEKAAREHALAVRAPRHPRDDAGPALRRARQDRKSVV